MKWIKRLLFLLVFLGVSCFAMVLLLPYLNDYRTYSAHPAAQA